MKIHKKCIKASRYAAWNNKLPSRRELQILKFVNAHDNYKLADIREAIWPGLLDRCYKSVLQYEAYHMQLPPRIDALAKHMASGYGSSIIAKMVKHGWLVYDTTYRWHITEHGVAKLVTNDLVAD